MRLNNILAALFMLVVPSVVAATVVDETGAPLVDLVVLPFANNTLDSRVHEILEAPLLEILRQQGLQVMSSRDVRPLLREHRIRSRGWIGRRAAAQVAVGTGAKHALLGSWDVFRSDGNPEIGLSMRILDLEHMTVLAAASRGVTGEDEVGLFERGRVGDLEVLADRVLREAVADLWPIPVYQEPRMSWYGCYQVALVPPNNYSDTRYAGETLNGLLLTAMLKGGFSVLEPGFVRELGIDREQVSRGEIDDASARALEEQYGVCRIVTGSVERLETSSGDPVVSYPRVSLGLRIIDIRNGRVYLVQEVEGAGNQTDGFFQRGRTHSLVTLTSKLLAGFVADWQKVNREDILHGQR